MQFTAGENNYTLGRGQCLFARFIKGTRKPGAFLYFGNTPSLSINTTTEELKHYSSEAGTKELDGSAPLRTDRALSLETDNISPENLALLFLGEAQHTAVAASAIADEAIAASQVVKGGMIPLGVTDSNNLGARNVSAVVLKNGAATLVEGVDYEVIPESGLVHILPGGSIADGTALTVNYAVTAYSATRVISNSNPIEGAFRFISENATGTNYDYIMPYVKLMPDGEFALKGDDWQKIKFKGDVLKLSPSTAAVFIGQRVFMP